MAAKQKWKCGICGSQYSSPIAVSEVLCPNQHPAQNKRARGGLKPMTLIEGSLPTRKKKTPHGT